MNKIKNRAFGFGALLQIIQNYFKNHYISHWDWKEGAKETLNPFPAILETLNDIWWSGYYISKNIGVVNNEVQHTNKITLWDKLLLTYTSVIRPVLFNFEWRYGDRGSYGYTKFNWWNLTYYRDHTEFFDDRYQHSWKDKKFLFAKNWKDYDHRYWKHCSHGTWKSEVSEDIYENELKQLAEGIYNDEQI